MRPIIRDTLIGATLLFVYTVIETATQRAVNYAFDLREEHEKRKKKKKRA